MRTTVGQEAELALEFVLVSRNILCPDEDERFQPHGKLGLFNLRTLLLVEKAFVLMSIEVACRVLLSIFSLILEWRGYRKLQALRHVGAIEGIFLIYQIIDSYIMWSVHPV